VWGMATDQNETITTIRADEVQGSTKVKILVVS
jgi:hypothetical protein